MTSKNNGRLAALLCAAFAIRALYCGLYPQAAPGGRMMDLNWYHTMAMSLLQQGSLLDPQGQLTASHEPGYPFFLSAVYFLAGASYFWVIVAHCLLGAATVLLIFLLGKMIFGPVVAWLAAFLACGYPQFLYYTSRPERETWLVFLFILGLFMLAWVCRKPSLKLFFMTGLVWALGPLTHSVFLLPGLFAGVAAWKILHARGYKTRRFLAAYFAAFMGFYALWPLRNFLVFHQPIVGTTGGGAHLYISLIVPNDVAGTPAEEAYVRQDPVCQKAVGLAAEAVDRHFYRAAFQWIGEHPGRYFGVMLGSLAKLWRLYPYPRDYGMSYRVIKWVALLSDGWLIPLGAIGMILAWGRFPETSLLNAVLFSVTVAYMIFWAIVRYRLPLMSVVILYAAYALERVLRWVFPNVFSAMRNGEIF